MTPEQEEQVRRALAAAAAAERPDEPTMPTPVSARLDAVLADLVEARSPGAPSGDELAARRRRRLPQVLVAAAAVAVIAVAGGVVATRGLVGSGAADSTAAGSAASDRSTGTAGPGGAASEGGRALLPSVAPDSGLSARGTVPRLRTATLSADVARVVAAAPTFVSGDRVTSPAPPAGSAGPGCAVPAAGKGEVAIDVRLDGRRATLLLSPPSGGARVARIYSCDDAANPLDRVRVPLR